MRNAITTVCALALLAAGCGEQNGIRPPDQVEQDNLTQVGELYRHYQATKNKPPQRLADFNSVRTMAGNGFEAIRTGKVVVLYGATLPDVSEEPGQVESNEVLAYQKEVPESGGYVLLLNRTVKKMTADEFKAAPKPAGSKPGDSAPVSKN